MAKNIERGRAVMERVYARAQSEIKWRGVHPAEIFVSPADWDDLDAYLQSVAQVPAPDSMMGPTTGMRIRVGDGSGELVDVRNLGWIVVA